MLIHDLGRQHVGKMAGVYFASAKLGQKTLHALAHAGREVGVLERLDEEVGHVDDGVGKDASSTRSACKVCGLEWGEWSGGGRTRVWTQLETTRYRTQRTGVHLHSFGAGCDTS